MTTRRLFLGFFLLISLFFNVETLAADPALYSQKEVRKHAFISLADLHFDPFLSCQKMPCLLIQKLQAAPVSQWDAILAQYDKSQPVYGKDSNYSLLKSALAAAQKEGQQPNVDFVLVLGDFLAHDYDKKFKRYSGDSSQAGYLTFVKKTFQFLANELNQAFPRLDVYLVVGNNDSYGKDYSVEPQGAFFRDLSLSQAFLIKNKGNRRDFQQSFPRGGYYALNSPKDPNLRLLFLNSVLFSNKANGPRLQQAAQAQLDWLHQELSSVRQKKQKVLIAMHIPTGIDVYTTLFVPFGLIQFWKEAYTQQFLEEIRQTSNQVMGIFQAHTHADAFQVLTAANYRSVPFTGTPSISPIFGNNPGFKIYNYSLPALRLVGFSTYYLPLNNKNQWEKEYDFEEAYQLNQSEDEMVKGMLQLQPRGELADHYKAYYAVNRDSQPITKRNKWLPYYWCAIRGLTSPEYRSCLSTGV